jgi:alpha-1,2-mannosyltransferase
MSISAAAPRRRPPAAALVAAACGWLLAIAVVAAVTAGDLSGHMVDLNVYRAGGLAVLHGSALYKIHANFSLPFTYPPISAILAVPLAAMPFGVAKLVWLPMIYVPLAIAVGIGFRPLLSRAGSYAPAVMAVLFCGSLLLFPVRQVLEFGQIDLFLLAICLVDCLATRPKWPRGALIGLATAIKLVPGVFIIYLLITGRRKAAAVAAASFAAWTALAFALAPADSVAYWTGALFDSNRLGGNGSAANQSLRGILLRAFLAARACWRRGNEMAGIAITGLLAAMLSPVAWIHHLCWVVVAIGVICGAGMSWRRNLLAGLIASLYLTSLPVFAQRLANLGRLPDETGLWLEDAFGLAALVVIVALTMIRITKSEQLAWLQPSSRRPGLASASGPVNTASASASEADGSFHDTR